MIFLGFAPGAAMLRAAVAIFCCMFIFSERKLRHMTAGLRLGEPVSVRVALFVMARTFSNILQRPLPTLRPRLTTALSFVLATTAADFHEFGDVLARLNDVGRVVVLGSKDAIEAANTARGGWLDVVPVM